MWNIFWKTRVQRASGKRHVETVNNGIVSYAWKTKKGSKNVEQDCIWQASDAPLQSHKAPPADRPTDRVSISGNKPSGDLSQQTEPLTAVLQLLTESCNGSVGLKLLMLTANWKAQEGGKKKTCFWLSRCEFTAMRWGSWCRSSLKLPDGWFTHPAFFFSRFFFLRLSLPCEAPSLQVVQRQSTNSSDEWSIGLIYVPGAIAWKWPGL